MHNCIKCNLAIIEYIWSGRSLLYLLLLPFSLVYGCFIAIIRLSYRLGLCKSWRAPVPIVVVGNLTVGGNGKTPMVIWLVKQLRKQGLRVGVISRGYAGKTEHYPLLITLDTTAYQAGDEPIMIARRTGVPVAVSPVRRKAIQTLLSVHTLDLIIADDGLQHYALARDIEIAVVDGERRFGNGWWLPAGPMREHIKRLRQVDAIIVNGGNAQKSEIAMCLQPGLAINLKTGTRSPLSEFTIVVAMAGIRHPSRFFSMLRQLHVSISRTVSFIDHQYYNEAELLELTPHNEALIMTEKDAVKCYTFAHNNWWYLPVDAQLSANVWPLLKKIIKIIH